MVEFGDANVLKNVSYIDKSKKNKVVKIYMMVLNAIFF